MSEHLPTIVAAVVSLFSGSGIVAMIIKHKLEEKDRKKNQTPVIEAPDVANHHTFAKLQRLKTNVNLPIDMINPGKKKLLDNIIENYLNIAEDELTQLGLKIDGGIITDEAILYKETITAISMILKKFYEYPRNSSYTKDEQKAIDAVLNHSYKYINYNNEQSILNIQHICHTPFCRDINIKRLNVLNALYREIDVKILMYTMVVLLIPDEELKGLKFRGITI